MASCGLVALFAVVCCGCSIPIRGGTILQQVGPPPCASVEDVDNDGAGQRLSDFIAVGSCTIDDKLFSDFTFTGGMSGLAAADIPVRTVETAFSPGLLFAPGTQLQAAAGQTKTMSIGYRVTVQPGGNAIEDNTLD